MKPIEVAREITYPLREAAIVLAMIGFWLLGSFARIGGLLGLFLAAILLPAFVRYASYLLEARAHGREAPVLGIELFNWMESFWSLFPLVQLVFLATLVFGLTTYVSATAAVTVAIVVLLLLPASFAVLGVTRAPLTSLNPVALLRLLKTVGPGYLWIPATTVFLSALLYFARRNGLPVFFANLLAIYIFFTLFTMTGALLRAHQIAAQIDIPAPLEPDENQVSARRAAERKRVANHAYGFVSRGNRTGGLQHIEAWLGSDDTSDEAWLWFFNEMLTWESTDAALELAQKQLHRLLQEQREIEFIKLLSRCLLVDERFRPQPEIQQASIALLQDHGRNDLLGQLGYR